MERVGGTQRIKVDVRVLAATNKDLHGGDPGRPVPRGSVLPPERHPDLRAAAARARQDDIPLLAEHFMAMLPPSTGAGRSGSTRARSACCGGTRGPATSASCAMSIERLVIMVPGDDHHRAGPGVPGQRSGGDRGDDAGRRGAAAAAARGARSVRAATTSCARWRSSRATCRGPPTCSASSAAISIGRCARSASRRASAPKRSRQSRSLFSRTCVRAEAFELQVVLGGRDQRRLRHQADDFALQHGHAVARRLALDQLEHAEDRRLLEVRQVHRHLRDAASSSSMPIALTKRRPPLLMRTAAAIFFATSSRSVARLML